MRRLLFACLLASVFEWLPVTLAAQIAPTTLTGTVFDQTHNPLPRALVGLLNPAGADVARSLTNDQGRFRFDGLTASRYTVEASLTGFETKRTTAAPGSEVELVLPVAPIRESIVVSATRTEAPTGQIGASTSVITEKEIQDRLVLPVSDLLQTAPGVTVVRSGGLGGLTSAFVRGGESDYNKVLLDGVPVNEPGGAFDFSNLAAEDLERIEVVRGPQSALFGSDAMASVVQIFTRRGHAETTRPHFSLGAEGGKYHTWRTRGGMSGQAGSFDYSLHWARFSTNNEVPNGFFHDTTVSGNFGFALGERTALRLILRGELSRAGTSGQTAFGQSDLDSFFRRRDGYGGFSIRNETTLFWEQRLTYTFSRSRQISRDLGQDPPFVPTFEGHVAQCPDPVTQIIGPCPFFDFSFDFVNDTRRHHLSYQSDLRAGALDQPLGRHVFTFAVEWDRELGSLGDRLSGEPPTRAKRDNFGGTFQDQMIRGPIYLTYGVRVEDNESFGRTVVPRASIAYYVRKSGKRLGATKLKFNFGLGVKEPKFLESFSPVPSFKGNPSLSPERARSFDFGAEQRFWRDRGKLEVNWFDNRFRDLISFEVVSFSPFVATFFNIGRTKAKGAEVLLELVPLRGLRASGTYTYLNSQITQSAGPTDPVSGVGRPLLRRPRHSGSLQLSWDWRRLNITSTTLFVGTRADTDFIGFDPPLTSNPGYSNWDLAWSYHSSHHVTYFGIAQNLLNEDYMEALGFPALKFSYRGGIRVDF